MVTGSLGMAGNPTATLLTALGCCPGQCVLDFHVQIPSGASYHLVETSCLSLPMIQCTREVIPQDIWCLNRVTITLQEKFILWVHENEANNTLDLSLLRQQILAMQKA
jgi:hypothetical protein